MLPAFHKRFVVSVERYKVYLYFILKWPIITFSFNRWMKWSEKELNVHFHKFLKATNIPPAKYIISYNTKKNAGKKPSQKSSGRGMLKKHK